MDQGPPEMDSNQLGAAGGTVLSNVKKCNIGTGRHPHGPTQLFHYKSKLSNMKETQKGF